MRIITILFCLALLVLTAPVFAADTQTLAVTELRRAPASTTWTSAPVDLVSSQGLFSLGVEVFNGEVDVACETSLDGSLWLPGESLLVDFTSLSGANADGKTAVPFGLDFCRFVRFKVTAASAGSADFLLKLAYR